ncbi:MAG: ligase-associated DNA damage response exonuclease [Limnobacter sp.]|nr:ligase-associated DNA damage response exonuclease [Limnobacter sp.]
MDLVISRPQGLYCPPGDFYIDPWRPVDRALITHAHADHARSGHNHYLCAQPGAGVLKTRLGKINLQSLQYGQQIQHNGVTISFHPAGHVLGSAQVRLEYRGEVWVASGDYKVMPDLTCDGFEPVPCHTFITESTFGLPVYRWHPDAVIYQQINDWWAHNASLGKASVLYGYSFGKAQRLIAGIDPSIGSIVCHSAAEALNKAYREEGVKLPDTLLVSEVQDPAVFKTCLAIAPPAAEGASWMKRFGKNYSDAFASGWMALRGARRRRNVDKGFVMSDHADWYGLLQAIGATSCEQVIATHGYIDPLVRYLNEQGLKARGFKTEYGDIEE